MAGLHRGFSFGGHDEESFDRPRRYNDPPPPTSPPPLYTDSPTRQFDDPPPPPQHRSNASFSYQLPPIDTRAHPGRTLDHSLSQRTASTVTPGADNLGDAAAGGGLGGIALGVANSHARDSGLEAMRSVESLDRVGAGLLPERSYDTSDTPYIPTLPNRFSRDKDPFASPSPSRRSDPFEDGRRESSPAIAGNLVPRVKGHLAQGSTQTVGYPTQNIPASGRNTGYDDNPYNRYSTAWDARVAEGDIDPNQLDDRDDEGMQPSSLKGPSGGATTGVLAGGLKEVLGGFFGKKGYVNNRNRDTSGHYGPVGSKLSAYEEGVEKSDWLNGQTSGRKRMRWIVGTLIVLVIIGAIVGGVVGGLRRNKSTNNGSSTTSLSQESAAQDDAGGDLNKDSAEIKKLMGNANLHKVFPGMDYTPFNAQYPACLADPPSQNNVTRDMAVLSQLTNTVRLYGTDCNQTDMVLHSIKQLGLTDMKVWLGVWLDNNATTTNRGINAMYDILSRNGQDLFAGVIVGNEVLYRKDMTESQLGDILSSVKTNFTSLKYTLPVATSDLGDDWTANLAADVDVIMSSKWLFSLSPFCHNFEVS